MKTLDERYVNHKVFSELSRYADFYRILAFSVWRFCPVGTSAICNFDSYIYSSMQGTMESILTILREGRINDAYALLRKYYDCAVINIYLSLYLKDELNKSNFIVSAIDDWLKGTAQLPKFRMMVSYVRSSNEVARITQLLEADDRYRRIRNRCNSHMHYNLFAHALLNDNEVFLKERHRVLDTFSFDVANLFILHLAYIFWISEHYMVSSDYVDSLDCGLTPEADSQHWVAPFIQEVFDDIITVRRPDIAAAIKQHTCMHLT